MTENYPTLPTPKHWERIADAIMSPKTARRLLLTGGTLLALGGLIHFLREPSGMTAALMTAGLSAGWWGR